VVDRGEGDLSSTHVSEGVLHRLEADALRLVPLPHVDSLVWIVVRESHQVLFRVGL
jgi:hypothetical protein